MLDGRKFSLFIAQPAPFYFYNKRNFSFTTRLPFHLQEIVLKGAQLSSGGGLLQIQGFETVQKRYFHVPETVRKPKQLYFLHYRR